MINSITDTVTLRNGLKMPRLGFGVCEVKDGQEVEQSVLAALETGYRTLILLRLISMKKG